MKPGALLELAVAGSLLIGSSVAFAQDTDSEHASVMQAKKVLLDASKAYSKAPAMMDVMTSVYSVQGMPDQTMTTKVRVGDGNLEATGIAMAIDVFLIDDIFYLQFAGEEGSGMPPRSTGTVKVETEGKYLDAAKSGMDQLMPYMPPQVLARWTDGIDGAADWFTFGMSENSAITGYELVETKEGQKRHEIHISGDAPMIPGSKTTCKVQIDPKTNLFSSVVITTPSDDAGNFATITSSFKTSMVERLESPIVVTLGDNPIFDDFAALSGAGMGSSMADLNPKIAEGTMAPEFDLVDQDGKSHSSVAYRGKILMLDWWGIW